MFNLKKREKDSENEKWIRASHSFEVHQPKVTRHLRMFTHTQSPPQNYYFAKYNCHIKKHHYENWIPCAAFLAAFGKCVLGRPESLSSSSGPSQRIVIYFSTCAETFARHLVGSIKISSSLAASCPRFSPAKTVKHSMTFHRSVVQCFPNS